MTLIPIRELAPADLRLLGHNLGPRLRKQTRVRPRSLALKAHPWHACPCPSHAPKAASAAPTCPRPAV